MGKKGSCNISSLLYQSTSSYIHKIQNHISTEQEQGQSVQAHALQHQKSRSYYITSSHTTFL